MIRRPLRQDRRGIAAVEFALMAPFLFMVLFGIFDVSYNLYVSTVLQGATNRAARASTMQNMNDAAIDQIVKDRVGDLMRSPNLTFERKAYSNFTDVSRPEDFTDINTNGVCDGGEPFIDANDNGGWDADRGRGGNGGARDAVVYTVTLEYRRMFPLWKVIGISDQVTQVSSTVLRNQPWELQAAEGNTVRNCT